MRYRKERVEDLLREEISSILFREIKDPGLGFVTILEVKVTADLKNAKILYSVYGDETVKESTAKVLKRSAGYVKFLLGERVKLRVMPDLTFVYDDRFEKMARIEEILKKDVHSSDD